MDGELLRTIGSIITDLEQLKQAVRDLEKEIKELNKDLSK